MDLFKIEQPFVFGAARYERGGHYGPVRHPQLDVAYLASGTALVRADGVEWNCRAGRATLLYTERELEVIYPVDTIQEVKWCQTGAIVAPTKSIKSVRAVSRDIEPSPLLLTLLSEGIALGDAQDQGTARVRDTLGAAVVNEYFRVANAKQQWEHLPIRIERAKSFIDGNFAGEGDFSLEAMARVAALSPNYFLEVFRRHIGQTPSQYVWHLRVTHGVKLLLKTGLPISVVAFESGFKCPHHFARVVRRDYGASPSDLRREKWQSDPRIAGVDVPDRIF